MPRAGLDRRKLVEAAILLVDREGLDGLTFRALADVLGVKPPSLYNHVESFDGLVGELRLTAMRELNGRITRAAAGKAGGDAIRAIATAWRLFAKQHPGLYATTVKAATRRDRALSAESAALMSLVLDVLTGFGWHGADAIHAARALRSSLHGFVVIERGDGFGLPPARDVSFEWMVDMLVTGLSVGKPSTGGSYSHDRLI
ncbi:MAG: WHG domain-containing protein [Labilithrix sp.]|nr:WHG domain-containing protein [Labilithrix sp.]